MSVPTGAGNYPAGVGDNDPYFDMPSVGDGEELDDEDRCELFQGYDKGDRCPNRATQTVEEPYTPGRFTQRVCEECARGQVRSGYRLVTEAA